MAIKLTNKTNVNGVSADWEFGEVRDKTLSVAGTDYSKINNSDYFQFFEKLMSEADITHNGNLDNTANGYQLYEAFRKLTRSYKVVQGLISDTGFTELANDTGETITFSKSSTGVYNLTAGSAIFTTNKTGVTIQGPTVSASAVLYAHSAIRQSSTVVRVNVTDCSTPSNMSATDMLGDRYIEIRIYD